MLFSLFISQLNTHPEIWKKLQLLNVNDQGLLNVNETMTHQYARYVHYHGALRQHQAS
jgi:hypothetical protein